MKPLKHLRESRNLTQQQIADRIGVSRVTYTNWELGEREPDIATLLWLADFFGVTADYLIGRPNAQISFQRPTDEQSSVECMHAALEHALGRPINVEATSAMLNIFDLLTRPTE